eukprot:scaffold40165_cov60-Phaeocystis_antarctica.AAC.1
MALPGAARALVVKYAPLSEPHAATLCIAGCNPAHERLQPAAPRARGCDPTRTRYADPSEPRTTNSRSSSAASQSPTLLGQSVPASPM